MKNCGINLDFKLFGKNLWKVYNKDTGEEFRGFAVEQSGRKGTNESSFTVFYDGASIGGSKPRLKECAGIILKHYKAFNKG